MRNDTRPPAAPPRVDSRLPASSPRAAPAIQSSKLNPQPLKVLLVSCEVAPFAKVGGLADVAGALPKALVQQGHDVRVVMPSYPMVEQNSRFTLQPVHLGVPVPLTPDEYPAARHKMDVYSSTIQSGGAGPVIPVYMLRSDRYFRGVTSSRLIYPHPVEAYLFFNQAVFALARALDPEWIPDVIHYNDWHTGLGPVLLQMQHRPGGVFAHTASVFTIHNLAYQGQFDPRVLAALGLPPPVFTPAGGEYYGRFNFLKAGLIYADGVTTVSPTYAREIQTKEYGCGLEGVLKNLASQGRLWGILNGIDTDEYNPATDLRIVSHYSAANPAGKAPNRHSLQQEMGLQEQEEMPLLGLVSRFVAQKGLDLLAPILERLVEQGYQFAFLGQGDPLYEEVFRQVQARYPGRLAVRVGFDEGLGQRIYAGCDAFLMPSRFEPCGLGQLMSLRYGALPLARRTGGLADTVVDDDGMRPDANGFLFDGVAPDTLLECIKRLRSTFANRSRWQQLVLTAMSSDFSWSRSAAAYTAAYQDALRTVDS